MKYDQFEETEQKAKITKEEAKETSAKELGTETSTKADKDYYPASKAKTMLPKRDDNAHPYKKPNKLNKTVVWAGVGIISAGILATAIAVPLSLNHDNKDEGNGFNFGTEINFSDATTKAAMNALSAKVVTVSPLATGEVTKAYQSDKTIALQYKGKDTDGTAYFAAKSAQGTTAAPSPASPVAPVADIDSVVTVEFNKATGLLNRVVAQLSGTLNGNKVDDINIEYINGSTDATTSIKIDDKKLNAIAANIIATNIVPDKTFTIKKELTTYNDAVNKAPTDTHTGTSTGTGTGTSTGTSAGTSTGTSTGTGTKPVDTAAKAQALVAAKADAITKLTGVVAASGTTNADLLDEAKAEHQKAEDAINAATTEADVTTALAAGNKAIGNANKAYTAAIAKAAGNAAAATAQALKTAKTNAIDAVNKKLPSFATDKTVETADLTGALKTKFDAIKTAADKLIAAINGAADQTALTTADVFAPVQSAIDTYDAELATAESKYTTAHFDIAKDAKVQLIRDRANELLAADYPGTNAIAALATFNAEITTQANLVNAFTASGTAYDTAVAAAKTKIDADKDAVIEAKKLDDQAIADEVKVLQAITIPSQATQVIGVTQPTTPYDGAYTQPASFKTVAAVKAEEVTKQAVADAAKAYNDAYKANKLKKEIADEVVKLDAIKIVPKTTKVTDVDYPTTPVYPTYTQPTTFASVAEVKTEETTKTTAMNDAKAFNDAYKVLTDKAAADKVLADAKDTAIKALHNAATKDGDTNTNLLDAAKKAVTDATANINAATSTTDVTTALTSGNTAIDAANKAYTDAVQAAKDAAKLATETADLKKAKKAAIAELATKATSVKEETTAHEDAGGTTYKTIEAARGAGETAINAAATEAKVTDAKTAALAKIQDAIDAYKALPAPAAPTAPAAKVTTTTAADIIKELAKANIGDSKANLLKLISGLPGYDSATTTLTDGKLADKNIVNVTLKDGSVLTFTLDASGTDLVWTNTKTTPASSSDEPAPAYVADSVDIY